MVSFAQKFIGGKRQVVLRAKRSLDGTQADFLGTYVSGNTGIKVVASAAEPFALSVADGCNDSGSGVDRPVAFKTDWSPAGWADASTWADGTWYLYVDVNRTTGAVTAGKTLLPTNDDIVKPGSPGTGQHWFDTQNYESWVWNGSAWERVARYQVGHVVKSGASLTLTCYQINGFYMSEQVAIPALGSDTIKSHNVGSNKVQRLRQLVCVTPEHGYQVADVADVIEGSTARNAVSLWHTRFSVGTTRGNYVSSIIIRANGYDGVITAASWKQIFTVERVH